jgi:uncharacterized protein YjbJ (UPF0337 family)
LTRICVVIAINATRIVRVVRQIRKEHGMSAIDKAKNKLEDAAGQAKEKLGAATGDPDKKNEGKADQTKSNLKDAGEKVKDAFDH